MARRDSPPTIHSPLASNICCDSFVFFPTSLAKLQKTDPFMIENISLGMKRLRKVEKCDFILCTFTFLYI